MASRQDETIAAQQSCVTANDGVKPKGVTRRLNILAAEDNGLNEFVLRKLLEPIQPNITVVTNGEEACDAFRDGDFDIILMDIQMPLMDGMAAIKWIRSFEGERGRARTPIISLTANAMREQIAEYIAAGADANVSKPICEKALMAEIDRHCASPCVKARHLDWASI